jgi:hypothetical protein
MKQLPTTLLLFIALVSCKESGVELAQPSTFVRYFNGGSNDQAQMLLETSDKGFIILANTEAQGRSRIKLIKTDAYGNQIWQKFFPEFTGSYNGSFAGHGMAAIQDNSGTDTGYVIAGEDIDKRQLLMVLTDVNGSATQTTPKSFTGSLDIKGVAVACAKASGNYFVLAQAPTKVKDMVLMEINKTTLDTLWTKSYGAGKSQLANRLFLDSQEQSLYWGGSTKRSGSQAIRLIRSGINASIAGFDIPYGDLTYNLTGNDICRFGFGYAVIGSYNPLTSTLYDSIHFIRVSEQGNQLGGSGKSFPLKFSQSAPPGNSLCTTHDGGLLLLGTLALDAQGTDTDYYLIKIDAFGNKQWDAQHGSRFLDVGVNVIQASNGGYVVLGTTNLANVKSILLMKTDGEGKVE